MFEHTVIQIESIAEIILYTHLNTNKNLKLDRKCYSNTLEHK